MAETLPVNYFELFEIPVTYDIDHDQLQHRYRELQKAVHPDKYASASSQERRISMQQTSLINQALHTLKHPVERAMYLLQLEGVDFTMDNETTMDAAFLMEQMEMREALESIRDRDDPIAELDRISADIRSGMNRIATEFKQTYAAGELEQAREAVRKLQFLYKASKEVEELTVSIEDELM
ncbi:MAG: Fe-S protein assembly co-chaperone HscB [Thiotrichales bacterium]|nr:MAG: Fe-S protein assembly co-chaperone HscB [Thiotrichales bacterium]